MKLVETNRDYPVKPKVGDLVIRQRLMYEHGCYVYEVQKYRESRGKYATPGSYNWFSQTLEPFSTYEEAEKHIRG